MSVVATPKPERSFDNGGAALSAFWDLVYTRELHELQRFSWPTDRTDIEGFGTLVLRIRHDHGQDACVELEDGAVRVESHEGMIWGWCAAATSEALALIQAELSDAFPRSRAAEDEVPITFWSYSPHGPRSVSRRITVPRWEQIESNYATDAREHLDAMMRNFRPSHGGQLVLWQGPPGTGKTWALRALASEWRAWADFHYITDPEVFFGERADYMLDVILNSGAELDTSDDGSGAENRWHILLLEDTGEILAADAKEKTGQALSRLLNVVDGLIGQGLRILVLVTTNDELKRLHPAVSRPGRCAARIEFGELSADEVHAWASERGIAAAHERASLAEMFAIAEGYEARIDERVGFAA